MMLPPTNEHRGLPEAERSKEGSFPTGFQGRMALLTPWFYASSLVCYDTTNFYVLSLLVCGTLLLQS